MPFAERNEREKVSKVTLSLTVYFEDPFWVGVFEKTEDGMFSVCKVTFGAEPKDFEVFEFLLRRYRGLKFTVEIKSEFKWSADNKKRRLRNAKKSLENIGVGTKSMQALAAMREEMKNERKKMSKEEWETEKLRRFALRAQKRKEKHKGH